MKKSFLLLFALFCFVGTSFGQATGLKAIKKAGRALSTYNLDTKANADKLQEALELVNTAFESEEVKSDAESYLVKANVYSTVSNSIVNMSVLNPESAKGKDYSLATKAVDAYQKAYMMAEKKFVKKEALKGMSNLENIIENLGIVAYQNESWKDAFESFKGAISLSNVLKEAGEETRVDDKVKEDLIMNALAVGSQPNSGVDISSTLEEAIDMGINNPSVYQIAYSTFEKTNKEKAVDYLNKGAALFPEDSGLLFAQINYYIGEGKLEVLIDKLKAAIAAEPDNASVYATLGNVYDQLYVQATDEGNAEKSAEYFDGAKEYYLKATEIDPQSFNSYYGLGALYFNKAAKVGKELNDLSSDFSAAGIKKYDAKKAEMNSFYEESFPYLEAAEKINPNDPLVIQALKEYYVRTSQMDKADIYKAKMEAIQSGQ